MLNAHNTIEISGEETVQSGWILDSWRAAIYSKSLTMETTVTSDPGQEEDHHESISVSAQVYGNQGSYQLAKIEADAFNLNFRFYSHNHLREIYDEQGYGHSFTDGLFPSSDFFKSVVPQMAGIDPYKMESHVHISHMKVERPFRFSPAIGATLDSFVARYRHLDTVVTIDSRMFEYGAEPKEDSKRDHWRWTCKKVFSEAMKSRGAKRIPGSTIWVFNMTEAEKRKKRIRRFAKI